MSIVSRDSCCYFSCEAGKMFILFDGGVVCAPDPPLAIPRPLIILTHFTCSPYILVVSIYSTAIA